MENQKNIILVDWLTFTCSSWSLKDILTEFGLLDIQFEPCNYGRYGYKSMCQFHGISILEDGFNASMGICVEMSGSGCRAFESYSTITLLECLRRLAYFSDDFKITRIDLAYDDFEGILNMDQILDDTDEHNYTSRSHYWEVDYGSNGQTIYIGSPKSDTRIRIYNKALERGFTDGLHWIRVELQLRDTNAKGTILRIFESDSIGTVFSGLLRNYLIFRSPDFSDSNKSRWPVADYWDSLLGSVSSISVFTRKKEDYNVFNLQRFLVDQVGGALVTWATVSSLDELEDMVVKRHHVLNPKYQKIIHDWEVRHGQA